MEFERLTSRDQVISFLSFVASSESHRISEALIPLDELPTFLCRLWTDELYVPSERYFDCLRGDLSAADTEQFFSHFSPDEKLALERFHRFLELRLEMNPDLTKDSPPAYESDFWNHTMKDAITALDYFGIDLRSIREREEMICEYFAARRKRSVGSVKNKLT